ncbi:unnamed protein product [Cercopithifilaria johnstoni]|uniref:Uncharacterized protein n=1 Tax=Cercopithifilaria johnstoni TaxID=2874296 RepID=A0A8J2M3M1_9BILA|nr:unnamed protein product [Cercopithifilaria johnstoni]
MSLFLFAIILALSMIFLEIHQSFSEVDKNDEMNGMHHFISERQQLPHVRLVRDLLSTERYDSSVRPVGNHSKSLMVHISMSLYQVIDVDEPSQCLTLSVWMTQKWVDEFLDWDPNDYNMINSTVLPHDVLWIPDTFIYNSMDMNRDKSERFMNVIVKSRYWNGKYGAEVFFSYPALYTIRCHIDIHYFPYDHQNCTLTLGSWTSSKALLNYKADKIVSMHSYIPNEEWDVLSFNLYRHEYQYACCKDPWIIIEGSLIIRRKPLYYIVNLIIPTIILTLVAIVGFFTPSSTNDERREKITIGITALLAISILMLMVSNQMPTTSDFVPLITWFYLSNIIIISTAIFCTCIVHYIHGNYKNHKLPPNVVRILFFKYICNCLCISPPYQLMMLWNRSKVKSDSNIGGTQQRASRLSAKENWARIPLTLKDISARSKGQSKVMHEESSLTSIMQKIRKISTDHKDVSPWNTAVQFIRFTNDNLPQKIESVELKSLKYHRQCTLEWEFLATIVDRIFLLLFSTIIIFIIIALTLTAKLAQYHFDGAREIVHN